MNIIKALRKQENLRETYNVCAKILGNIEASKDACDPLALSHWERSESGRARAGLMFVSP